MSKTGGIAAGQLKSIVERIERMEEEKKSVADDIRDIYAEAKANGFDTKTIRAVIRLRKQDRAEREEQEALLDLYLHALGMLPDQDTSPTELERAAKDFTDVVGRPVEPTEQEKSDGVIAAFEDKDGNRSSLAVGERARSKTKARPKSITERAADDSSLAAVTSPALS